MMHRKYAPIQITITCLMVLGIFVALILVPNLHQPRTGVLAGMVGPSAITPGQWAAIQGAEILLLSTTSHYPIYLPLVKR